MDLTQLRYFQTVAKTGNVSKAAEKLFVTQPNLSKSIARLEEELGVPLFEHRKGKILLNEYGRVFLGSVELAFHELAKGTQTIQRMYETNQHVLRLGCCVDDFLPDMLRDFTVKYPDVGLRQFSCPYDDVADKLLDQSADIIISNRPPENENIRYLELGRQDYVLLMNAKHPLAGRDGIWLDDLRNEKFICDSSRMNLSELKELCLSRGFEPEVAYEVESSALIYHLLRLNSGVSFMPMPQLLKIRRIFPDSADEIHMAYIMDDIPKAVIGLAYHRSFTFNHAANCLLEYVRQFFKNEVRELEEQHLIRHTEKTETTTEQ